jgi:hypothetical protein
MSGGCIRIWLESVEVEYGHFPGGTKKNMKTSDMIFGISPRIRTGYFKNTSTDCYRYDILLVG